jgi:hypothetical protein
MAVKVRHHQGYSSDGEHLSQAGGGFGRGRSAADARGPEHDLTPRADAVGSGPPASPAGGSGDAADTTW